MGGKDIEGAPFVVKTYQLVSDPINEALVAWSPTRDSFVVIKPIEFAHEILPKYFKHNNFCSFIRQLNTYGFHKVEGKQWEFRHELFRQNEPLLLKEIKRRLSKKRENEAPVEPDTPDNVKFQAVSPPAALTTTQTPEHKATPLFSGTPDKAEDEDEVEKLKGINVILMNEVIRLQQQQQTTQGTIQQILDELIESRRTQVSLQHKLDSLAAQFQSGPVKQESGYNLKGSDETTLALNDLAHLELTPELELNIANLLHITPPASPYHTTNYAPASPYHTPASPLHPPLFTPNSPVHLPQSPQLPTSPQNLGNYY